MKDTTEQQFGNELTSFFMLVILNLILGALAMAFGIQGIVLTMIQYAEEPTILHFLLSAISFIVGSAGIGIGIFWIKTSAKILQGITKIREEYRNHTGPLPPETLTGWIIAVLAHYRENRTVIRRMAFIATIGGVIFLAFGVANLVQGVQAVTADGGQISGYLAFLAGGINLTIGLITFRFARGFKYYSDVWDLRLDKAGKGEESLKQTLENR